MKGLGSLKQDLCDGLKCAHQRRTKKQICILYLSKVGSVLCFLREDAYGWERNGRGIVTRRRDENAFRLSYSIRKLQEVFLEAKKKKADIQDPS